MKIIYDFPPNIEEIKRYFSINKNTVFTYRDLYNPNHNEISPILLAHEETHARQQGDKVEEWWGRYLIDRDFVFSQEVEAYQNQFKFFCGVFKDRNTQTRFLNTIASDLSGELYGNLCSMSEAVKIILDRNKK